MKTFTERFGPEDEYEVTLEIQADETQGWCTNRKTRMGASLAALDSTGVLTGNKPDEDVDSEIIAEIMLWAEANGY